MDPILTQGFWVDYSPMESNCLPAWLWWNGTFADKKASCAEWRYPSLMKSWFCWNSGFLNASCKPLRTTIPVRTTSSWSTSSPSGSVPFPQGVHLQSTPDAARSLSLSPSITQPTKRAAPAYQRHPSGLHQIHTLVKPCFAPAEGGLFLPFSCRHVGSWNSQYPQRRIWAGHRKEQFLPQEDQLGILPPQLGSRKLLAANHHVCNPSK